MQTYTRTQDEANSRFSPFSERAKNWEESSGSNDAAATCGKGEVYELLRQVRQITRTWSHLYINTSFMDLKYTQLYTANSTFRADSVVGVATRYGLDGRGSESRWWDLLTAPFQTGPGAHPASCTMGTGFPGG